VITLPDSGDIQVATRWPEVNTYRSAVIRAGRLEHRMRMAFDQLEECRRRVSGTNPADRRLQDRLLRRYRDAEFDHELAVNVMAAASDAAFAVAPVAAARVWLSVESYSARLFREREADRVRRGEAA
jgi:hypothetical protein